VPSAGRPCVHFQNEERHLPANLLHYSLPRENAPTGKRLSPAFLASLMHPRRFPGSVHNPAQGQNPRQPRIIPSTTTKYSRFGKIGFVPQNSAPKSGPEFCTKMHKRKAPPNRDWLRSADSLAAQPCLGPLTLFGHVTRSRQVRAAFRPRTRRPAQLCDGIRRAQLVRIAAQHSGRRIKWQMDW
jgi:hypothetical protein